MSGDAPGVAQLVQTQPWHWYFSVGLPKAFTGTLLLIPGKYLWGLSSLRRVSPLRFFKECWDTDDTKYGISPEGS